MWAGVRFIAILCIVVLTGCRKEDFGHVQLQIIPGTAAATASLYLDGIKLDFSRGSTVLMRFAEGTIALKATDSYFIPAICKIVVRKDRLSILTVLITEAPPRCVCQIRAPESTPTDPVCT